MVSSIVPIVTLCEITPATASSVLALRAGPDQERFVSGVAEASVKGRGLGARAVGLVADAVRHEGGRALLTSCVRGEGSRQGSYERLGFVWTGEVDSPGEPDLALDLEPGAAR